MFPSDYFTPYFFPPTFDPRGIPTGSGSGGGASMFPARLFPVRMWPRRMFPDTAGPGSGGGTNPPPPTAVDIRQAVYQALLNDPDIAAVVGPRVYPNSLPQRAKFPCLVYRLVDNPRHCNLDGYTGQAAARVQVDVWAYRLADAVTLRSIVRDLWAGYQGLLSGLYVKSAIPLGEEDLTEEPDDASDRKELHIAFDWRLTFQEKSAG